MKHRLTKVPHLVGYRVKGDLIANDDAERELRPEHVIAATGYRLDLDRLPFLSSEVRSKLRSVSTNPVLSASFESSLPGLYFLGAIAANSFGLVMRFAAGANFAARKNIKEFGTHNVRSRRLRIYANFRDGDLSTEIASRRGMGGHF